MTWENCRRCNRKLTNEKSREVGYGKVCLKKIGAVEQEKFDQFYAPYEYCDCGSSTCDICNPGWELEDEYDWEDDYFWEDYA